MIKDGLYIWICFFQIFLIRVLPAQDFFELQSEQKERDHALKHGLLKINTWHFKYDKNGRSADSALSEQVVYNTKGDRLQLYKKYSSGIIRLSYQIRYDSSSGRINRIDGISAVTIVDYPEENSGPPRSGNPIAGTTADVRIYNKKGHLVEWTKWKNNSLSGKGVFQYDSLGRCVKEFLQTENNVVSRKEHFYRPGLNESRRIDGKEGYMMELRDFSKYDERGNETERWSEWPDGTGAGKIFMIYDDKNCLVEEYQNSAENPHNTRKYKYDSNGLLLESLSYGQNNKPFSFLKFTYEFY
jgi:hypothetical protein